LDEHIVCIIQFCSLGELQQSGQTDSSVG
jgi:hypothetical protein